MLLLITVTSSETNYTSSNLEVFHILVNYGMTLFHAGRDYYPLKDNLRLKNVELQNATVYNLKSIYEACIPEVQSLPWKLEEKGTWKVTSRCFKLNWCIGFDELRVEAQSKLNTFFKTKVCEIDGLI